MTFEDWALNSGYKHPEFGITVNKTTYLLMQSAWNAAIITACGVVGGITDDDVEILTEMVKLLDK
jgi:hypothetical protein